mmetsp:Transcript_37990/g.105708  ORF Transcript_37990/g.105708 Transcript_37990/m.105708 type:complete len:218 (-) Transcript_37990:6-659(-)
MSSHRPWLSACETTSAESKIFRWTTWPSPKTYFPVVTRLKRPTSSGRWSCNCLWSSSSSSESSSGATTSVGSVGAHQATPPGRPPCGGPCAAPAARSAEAAGPMRRHPPTCGASGFIISSSFEASLLQFKGAAVFSFSSSSQVLLLGSSTLHSLLPRADTALKPRPPATEQPEAALAVEASTSFPFCDTWLAAASPWPATAAAQGTCGCAVQRLCRL